MSRTRSVPQRKHLFSASVGDYHQIDLQHLSTNVPSEIAWKPVLEMCFDNFLQNVPNDRSFEDLDFVCWHWLRLASIEKKHSVALQTPIWF